MYCAVLLKYNVRKSTFQIEEQGNLKKLKMSFNVLISNKYQLERAISANHIRIKALFVSLPW